MRLLSFSLLCLFLYACQEAPSVPTVIAKGEIRYLEDKRELRGELSLFRGDSLPGSMVYRPDAGKVAFLGSAMQADELSDRQRWRTTMKVDYPADLRFTFPTEDALNAPRTTLTINFPPPSTDSLPSSIDRKRSLRFAAGTQALTADENIVVFFEPEDRSERPRRIVVAGPTASEKITLPSTTLEDIPTGRHSVYLIKQKIARDTLEGVIAATQLSYHTRTKSVEVVE